MNRVCYKCKVEKPLEEFGKLSRDSSGHRHICKVCTRADSKRRHGIKRAQKLAAEPSQAAVQLTNPSCPMHTAVRGAGVCERCATKLKGRQERWCSEACSKWWYENHTWTGAKSVAKKRTLIKRERGGWTWYRCEHCEAPTTSPEVNHKTPVLGAHGVNGCHHHNDGLEVLCHECHLKVTRAQRAAGLFKRAA